MGKKINQELQDRILELEKENKKLKMRLRKSSSYIMEVHNFIGTQKLKKFRDSQSA